MSSSLQPNSSWSLLHSALAEAALSAASSWALKEIQSQRCFLLLHSAYTFTERHLKSAALCLGWGCSLCCLLLGLKGDTITKMFFVASFGLHFYRKAPEVCCILPWLRLLSLLPPLGPSRRYNQKYAFCCFIPLTLLQKGAWSLLHSALAEAVLSAASSWAFKEIQSERCFLLLHSAYTFTERHLKSAAFCLG